MISFSHALVERRKGKWIHVGNYTSEFTVKPICKRIFLEKHTMRF